MAIEPTIVVLTTGGTIAMRDDGEGARPIVGGEALLGEIIIPAVLEIESFANVPSSHLTIPDLWALRERIMGHRARPEVAGVLVTHGTDTMEESAFFLDLTLPRGRPVALTGAMRTHSDLAYEGRHNLYTALLTLIDPGSANRGTLVVMNDEVHAARYVMKVNSHNADAFASPGWGTMGRLFGDRLLWGWGAPPAEPPFTAPPEPDVHLLSVVSAADPIALEALVARGVRGIVIEGVGADRVPPTWMAAIREGIARGITIIIASRVPVSYTEDAYGYPGAYRDLLAAGVRFAEELSGPKARLRLMLELGAEGERWNVETLKR